MKIGYIILLAIMAAMLAINISYIWYDSPLNRELPCVLFHKNLMKRYEAFSMGFLYLFCVAMVSGWVLAFVFLYPRYNLIQWC